MGLVTVHLLSISLKFTNSLYRFDIKGFIMIDCDLTAVTHNMPFFIKLKTLLIKNKNMVLFLMKYQWLYRLIMHSL